MLETHIMNHCDLSYCCNLSYNIGSCLCVQRMSMFVAQLLFVRAAMFAFCWAMKTGKHQISNQRSSAPGAL